MVSQAPVFRREGDKVFLETTFAPEILVTPELLRWADERFVKRVGFRDFAILCENARQRYRIVRLDRERYAYVCRATA